MWILDQRLGGEQSTISAEVRRCRTEAKQTTAGPSPHVAELEPLSRVCSQTKRGNSRQPVSLKDNLGINPSTPVACDSVIPRHHSRPLDWCHQHRGISRVQTQLASDLPQPPMESAVATCFEKNENFLSPIAWLRYTRFESPTRTGIRNWSGVALNSLGLATSGLAALLGSSCAWVAWKLNRELGRAGAGAENPHKDG
ncbi:hypothetical protein ASPBRDRAFT_71184 [Aspergillus brasiliensis CBS 101740]|uniref:Uncharacterized protein n=1 Tax=Aspergillus brasiliensis (strain CBS 101740 / IMI 381727 / IBT 21946) TaxID=767769 RepID=A0A1L9V1V7_ASPBC|nr:hypothetical protein ASPBRDRAFT_71184 [Aspergillus brasiliensis CBS 101740]